MLLWPRRFAKSVLAQAVGPFLPANAPLILCYHRVVDEFDREAQLTMRGSLVSETMLARHIECIGRRRQFVPLEEVSEAWARGGRSAKSLAAITFDDGYRDVYDHAFPILQSHGIPATVFVVTALIGTSQVPTHDRLYRLVARAMPTWPNPGEAVARLLMEAGVAPRRADFWPMAWTPHALTRVLLTELPRVAQLAVADQLESSLGPDDVAISEGALPLTWRMLAEMQRAGMTVGSHTRHHVLLPREPPEVMRDEAVRSRRDLEDRLGCRVDHFAYPDGAFNRDAVDTLEAAGYRFGYTICSHRDDARPWLTIPRRVLWEHSAVDSLGRFSAPILTCQAHGLLTGRTDCTWNSHA